MILVDYLGVRFEFCLEFAGVVVLGGLGVAFDDFGVGFDGFVVLLGFLVGSETK